MESSNSILLNICVCTIDKRIEMYNTLSAKILNQIAEVSQKYGFRVANLYTHFNETMSIGAKRNELLNGCNAKFVVFIDDDDDISDDYVQQIVAVIYENPSIDCIGIKGKISFDGSNEKKWEISKDFGSWYEDQGSYFRTPNHISPVRLDIAKRVGFPNISNGEDFAYSMGILPYLHSEIKIDKELYYYQFVSKK
jgi:glycosyltransferase involved in cell wall biosynthesis